MPRYYCDYCDTYLTHDSPSVRKQHNAGYKHKANVRSYYQQYEAQLNQSLIDQKVKEHLGAFRPGPPPYPLRPPMPMPMPVPMPMHANPLMPGMRPLPVLPRPPPGVPGYPMQQMMAPTAAPPPPGQLNSFPRPVNAPYPPPPMAPPGSTGMPASSGAPPTYTPMYQGNMTATAPPPSSNDESSDAKSHSPPEAAIH